LACEQVQPSPLRGADGVANRPVTGRYSAPSHASSDLLQPRTPTTTCELSSLGGFHEQLTAVLQSLGGGLRDRSVGSHRSSRRTDRRAALSGRPRKGHGQVRRLYLDHDFEGSHQGSERPARLLEVPREVLESVRQAAAPHRDGLYASALGRQRKRNRDRQPHRFGMAEDRRRRGD
jgi:hypothetical protein